MLPSPIKHCRNCGTAVIYRIPDDGDTRERAVCPTCATIHYANPVNIVGTLPVLGDRVLLCKRNIEPRWGKWTLPAGFLELGESLSQGASRETEEEAGAQYDIGALFAVMNVLASGQVYFFYHAQLLNDRFSPGAETLEARLFTETEIPWNDLAFHTIHEALRLYFEDRRKERFGHIHTVDVN